MALDTELLPVPVSGGLAESVDPTAAAPGSFLALDNVVYDRTGALHRRPGYRAMPVLDESAHRLDECEGELLAVDRMGEVSTRRADSNEMQPVTRGAVLSPATLTRAAHVRSHDHVTSGHVIAWGDYTVTTYTLQDERTEQPLGLMWRVVEADTGALVVPDSPLDDQEWIIPGPPIVEHAAFVLGESLVVVWRDDDTFAIHTYASPTSNPDRATYTIDHGVAEQWDACAVPNGDGAVGLAWLQSGGMHVRRIRTNGVVDASLDTDGDDKWFGRIGICYGAGIIGIVYTTREDEDGEAWAVHGAMLSSTVLTTIQHAQLSTDDPFYQVSKCACVIDETGALWGAWQAIREPFLTGYGEGGTWSRAMNADGSLRSYFMRPMWHLGLASRPWAMSDGRVFVFCANAGSAGGIERYLRGVALVCLSDERHPMLRLDGTCASLDAYQADMPLLPAVDELTSGQLVVPALVHTTSTRAGLDAVTVDLSAPQPGLWGSAMAQRLMHHTGSLLTVYDGMRAIESGYMHPPYILRADLLPGESGLDGPDDPAGTATYAYVAVYAWYDARGNLHVSEPSPPFVRTLGYDDSGSRVSLNIATICATRRVLQYGEHREVQIRIYRTNKDSPETFYQIGPTLRNDPSVGQLSIIDGATSLTGPVLYTSGGVLEATMPPPMAAVCAAKNRMWGVSSEDPREIWFSQTLVQGEAPRWHKGLTLRIDDSPDGATAIAALDDKVIVFTTTRVYWVSGDGPEDTGAGASFGGPYLLTTTAGCIDARSVLSHDGGVMFQSRRGIYQIGRGLQLSYIGAGVETTTRDYPTVLSAVLDHARGRAIYLCESRTASRIVVYDYAHAGGAWMTWTLNGTRHLAQAMWRGLHVLATSDSAVCIERGAGDFMSSRDPDGLVPPVTIDTVWMRPDAVLERCQRVRHVVVTGRREGPHTLIVELMTDYDETTVRQARSFDRTEYAGVVERLDVHVATQKCASIRIRIRDTHGGAPAVDERRPGLLLQGITIEAGVKPGRSKLAISNRK